jgi:S1-C subfamily serine protease
VENSKAMTEALMLSTTRISTFEGARALTAATGFFFRRDGALYLVTSRHVLQDPHGAHFPDRIEIVLHVDALNLTRTVTVGIPLYRHGQAVWRQAADSGGEVDVAVIELEPGALQGTVLHAFGPEHLQATLDAVPIGTPLLLVGFPLGFYDTLHHLPVARHAIVASAFGVRFQGEGYFLTDARMHRGSSGAPVVTRSASGGELPWTLLGVHSARLDMAGRDRVQDDVLGLNCAWYADILMTLTGGASPP